MAKSPHHNTGYSGTPLVKKLGFIGETVFVKNPPAHYAALFGADDTAFTETRSAKSASAFHLFIIKASELSEIAKLRALMPPAKMLWVSWPKLSSALSHGLKEDDIRQAALDCGLVDIKVCAVDADWSGLKLTNRRKPV